MIFYDSCSFLRRAIALSEFFTLVGVSIFYDVCNKNGKQFFFLEKKRTKKSLQKRIQKESSANDDAFSRKLLNHNNSKKSYTVEIPGGGD